MDLNTECWYLQGHIPALRQRMMAFTSSLLTSDPEIPGLDSSIVIPPRRLHLTLGVMSLTDSVQLSGPSIGDEIPQKTLAAAITLLNTLRPRIIGLLQNTPLRVALNRVDIMRPDRGDIEQSHVMWAGPSRDDEDARKLKRVSGQFQASPSFHYSQTAYLTFNLRIHKRRVSTGWTSRRRQTAVEGENRASTSDRRC